MSADAESVVKVPPVASLHGEVRVPGDKSISHRAVMLGAIAEGETVITGLLEGEDNLSTIRAFRQMGVEMDGPEDGRLVIKGVGLYGLKAPDSVIDCGNSGTTARLIMGILAPSRFSSVITGDSSLKGRPMARIVEPLSLMGASISYKNKTSHLPIAVTGTPLKAINYSTPVASAQLKSALLLAGLFADGTTVVEESALSRDHTERMLSLFGASIKSEGKRVEITGGQELKGTDIFVPGDISSAAFFIVAASITPSSEISIKDVGINPTRTGIIDIIRKMGGSVELVNERDDYEPVADIRVKNAKLKGVEISGAELLPAIDEFPIICIAAAYATGKTVITGAGELRVKESDRISAMAEMLSNIGVTVTEFKDGLEIEGVGEGSVRGGSVESHGDHRNAMSAAVSAFASTDGVEVSGAGCVDVSFPGFFEMLAEVSK